MLAAALTFPVSVHADIVTGGNTTPISTSGVPPSATVSGTMFVGTASPPLGTLTVDSGSTLTANTLSVGNNGTGNGTVTITGTTSGPQTIINLLGPPNGSTTNNPLEVGQWGTGVMTVSQGAVINGGFSGGVPNANCVPSLCNVFIGQTAGSSGTLTLTGSGTTASFAGGFFVGNSAVFTTAVDGFDFGTPGGIATGTVNVTNGAVLNTYSGALANIFSTAASLGTEHAVAHVTVDGANSVWNVTQNPVTGFTAGMSMASSPNATATLDVTQGGKVAITGTDSYLVVGDGGSATVTIASGGRVDVTNLAMGQQSTGVGTVTVGNGVGQSVLTVSTLGVGNSSTALNQLTVNAGGLVNVTGNGMGIAGSVGSQGKVLVDGGELNVNFNVFGVGNSGAGTLEIKNGGTVSAVNLRLGGGTTAVGTVDVGSASELTVTNGINIGAQGSGTMTVHDGGSVVCNVSTCGFSGIGNAAGSTGSLTISGPGSSVTGLGQLNVGQATVASGFGTPGGTTTATVLIEGGGTLGTRGFSAVAAGISSSAPANGNEHVNSTVTIDGVGSSWQITFNALIQDQAFLAVSRAPNSTGTINVINGGTLSVTGGAAPNPTNTPGIQMSGSDTVIGGTSTLNVTGPGSSVVVNGDTGNIVVGRNGGNATLNISGGGQVYGGGTNGLTFMNVARAGGSHGMVNVDGAGSSLMLSGVGGAGTGPTSALRGAFLTIGRESGSVGMASVTDGGSILIRDNGQSATVGGVGMNLGRDAGSQGSLMVSGVGSQVIVESTGTGSLTPQITVGRAGTGTMTVTNGAMVAVNGNLQRNFVVGNTADDGAGAVGGNGTLTVSNGASITASWFAIGNNSIGGSIGGTGVTMFDNATLTLNGITVSPDDNSVTGGGVRVGRGAGTTGTLTLKNGAQINIDTPTTTPEIYLGGTGVATGGNGTIHMLSGSSISFTGTGATPNVVIGHSGIGLWTMDGGSTLSLPSDGTITLGATSAGVGQLEIRGSSSVQTGSLIVGNSGQGTVLMVSGTLAVSGNAIVGAGNNSSAPLPGGNGSVSQSGGSVTIFGGLTIGQGSGAGASAGGTGEYVLKGGSLTVTGPTIVGGGGADSSLGGIGTLFVLDGATMNAGTLLGIGADTGGSNGATGVVILDGGANIFATNLAVGAGGCLGGNGTVHTALVMSGASIGDCDTGISPSITSTANGAGTNVGGEGFLKPGRSPGTLVIDGSFDCISCTIVLDVQSCGVDCFVTDQIIFTDHTVIDLTKVKIAYAFLDNTNPDLFADSDNWVLDTFFKTIVDVGGVPTVEGISALGDLNDLFPTDPANYTATAADYVITDFVFTPEDGVDQEALIVEPIPPMNVPEPATIWLMLLGSLLLLRSAGMRRSVSRARRV